MLTTLDAPAVIEPKARYWSKIAIFPHAVGGGWGPRQNIAITLGTEKLEWCGYNT